MLWIWALAQEVFEKNLDDYWLAAVADHRAIPLADNSVDLIVSGWSFCYLVVWEENNWRSALLEGLKEVKRVLREESLVILIESLGTGVTQPQPPEKLKSYFGALTELGFRHSWIRTDYKFSSMDEAQDLTRFFFGEEMLEFISGGPEPILPECTGIWWCQRADL
jgi:SAM-dependent methyltransferase